MRASVVIVCGVTFMLTAAHAAWSQDVESSLRRAKERLDRSDYVGALEDFDRAVLTAPADVRGYLGRGDVFYTQSDYEQAIAAYEEAASHDAAAAREKLASAYNQRGHTAYNAARWDDAAADYRKGGELDPKQAYYFSNAGNVLRLKGDLKAALAELDKAVAVDAAYSATYENRGLAKLELNDPAGAAADFQKAAELGYDPDYDRYYAGLALLLAGNAEAALAEFKLAEELEWGTTANLHQGICLLKLGRNDEAEAQFKIYLDGGGAERAVVLGKLMAAGSPPEPKTALDYCTRAADRVTLSELALAHADWAQAMRLDPKCTEAWGQRGWRWYNDSSNGAAVWALDKAIALRSYPKFEDYKGRCWCLAELGEVDRAIADADMALRLSPNDTTVLWARARMLVKNGMLEEAIADFDAVLKSDATFASAYRERGLARLRLKRTSEASADFAKFRQMKPDQQAQLTTDISSAMRSTTPPWPPADMPPVEAAVVRAQGKYGRGENEAAVEEFSKVIELAPSDARGYRGRGRAHLSLHDYDAAKADLERAAAIENSAEIKYYLGFLENDLANAAYSDGRWDEAVTHYRRAAELVPEYWIFAYNLGLAQKKIGQTAESFANFDRAAATTPDDYDTRVERSIALRALGRFDEALADAEYLRRRGLNTLTSDLHRAHLLLDVGRTAEAAEGFERLIADGGYYAKGYNIAQIGLAVCLLRLNDDERAEEALTASAVSEYDAGQARLFAIDWKGRKPATFDEYYQRADMRARIGDREGALADWTEAAKLDPRALSVYLARGMDSWLIDANASAVADAERALAIDDRSARAWYIKGMALHDKLGPYDQCVEALNKAFELGESPSAYALRYRGEAHSALSQWDDALLDFEQAMLLNPEDYFALIERAYVLARAKRIDEALAALDEAAKVQPDNAKNHRVRGFILLAQGKRDEAQAEFDKYFEAVPTDRAKIEAEIAAVEAAN